MMKPLLPLLLALMCLSCIATAQCFNPPLPPDCNGTEPVVTDGETLPSGTTKWYYGSAIMFNSLTVDGGTLVVCGDLTVDKFYMNTGSVFVRQGGRLVIGSGIGAGLQFKGSCAIYNYGTCEIQRNLTLENNATALTPNRVVNALPSSVFKMANQYFVISNAYSSFVNNGRAEFWGLITDVQSTAGSVCLGNGSTTRMAVLINKVANSYVAPSGNACLNVYQYSEFYGRLTSDPTLFACLGSGHSSNSGCIPFGCAPNNWGSAQVFTNCLGCAAITALSVQFTGISALRFPGNVVRVNWQLLSAPDVARFTLLRSMDGEHFMAIDSLVSANGKTSFFMDDKSPVPGTHYYMIRYTNPVTGMITHSKSAKVSWSPGGINIYPVPFHDRFFVSLEEKTRLEKIMLTDINGRNLPVSSVQPVDAQTVEVILAGQLQAGVYLLHLQTDRTIITRTLMKN